MLQFNTAEQVANRIIQLVGTPLLNDELKHKHDIEDWLTDIERMKEDLCQLKL